jgi:hypothetical protein
MAAQGTTTLNFGTFPGSTDTTVVITGQAGISAGSLVEAWIYPTATADHNVDEHWVDPPEVYAGNVVAGTGFTIYGVLKKRTDITAIVDSQRQKKVDSPMTYGQWTVAWVWN